MSKINANYLKLPGSYLFATIGKKVKDYTAANPEKKIIRLGIGDVSLPLAPVIAQEMSQASLELGASETFHGYPDYEGYDFLRAAIIENDYKARGVDIGSDEIFVNDGAKCDSADLGDIFSLACKVAVCDPVYPVYVDSNALAGRAGEFLTEKGYWSNLIYMPCTEANGFVPEYPKETPDLIYLCFPNNPTGGAITKEQLQGWVDYAKRVGAVIIFDAAYEAYISEPGLPHSIYECEGAKECAIEMRSFSKNAGFTGVRLGFTVVPKTLMCDGVSLNTLWMKHQETKFNGVSYVVQRAGAAVYTPEGKTQTAKQVAYYMKNAREIREGLKACGYTVYGGENAPYVWLKTPERMTSWEFFDYLLENANVVGTPGSGFGPHGEGFFRLTGFGSYENTKAALERIRSI
ncbi:MAG: LL-diaminopimelate aminotransferase [Lachnospiraceae bacterium]|nr:LL-diaminopimelate aminotransferase [Lachnospiraceae bacterium]